MISSMRYVAGDPVDEHSYSVVEKRYIAQEKLLTEAAMMIPDTKTRLTTAVGELQAYLVLHRRWVHSGGWYTVCLIPVTCTQAEVSDKLPGVEEVTSATAALETSNAVLTTSNTATKEN